MAQTLSHYFSLDRRYSRSVNLERDLELPDALEGYILTERAVDALRRMLPAFTKTSPQRAWTLTGVYGTGKSAFAQFWAALWAGGPMGQKALEIAAAALGTDSPELQSLEQLPKRGLVLAVGTAQREPLSHTIVRALTQGAERFWRNRRKPDVFHDLVDLESEIAAGQPVTERQIELQIERQILPLLRAVAQAAKTDLLLLIDELGKTLEFAAQNQGAADLYLLQQIAELPRQAPYQVYLVGVLHQSFADYGERLASSEKKEWAKIHGRFEEIPFTESPEQMTRLIGRAITHQTPAKLEKGIQKQAASWFQHLVGHLELSDLSPEALAAAYPLHPLTTLVLPQLCTRYAQNDRSLFTFLTSAEPHAFRQFLESTALTGSQIPTLKLHQLYDYFVESVGMGLASRPNIQKWLEVQGVVADASRRSDLAPEVVQTLKTIGSLNLISSTGALRATQALSLLPLCESPDEIDQPNPWQAAIQTLQDKNLITYRKQGDELRIWEGSDFNVQLAIDQYCEQERRSLVEILSRVRPLKPLVAQRHSYRTGTLRYFERRYGDPTQDLSTLRVAKPDFDGLILYWMESRPLNQLLAQPQTQPPATTADGKPLIVVQTADLKTLRDRALEFAALQKIQASAAELQTDGVARREVRQRLVQAESLLDETLSQALEPQGCWLTGTAAPIRDRAALNAALSTVCNAVYSQSPILWNELINRRELTSQGAKARRELLEAMLQAGDREKLGLQGYGPEVSIYNSVLSESGIHRREEQEWGFYPPVGSGPSGPSSKKTGGKTGGKTDGKTNLAPVWQAIEAFCLEATDQPRRLDLLYELLAAPPYGVKSGVIPVLLAALLLYRLDDVGLYQDGTFVPVLTAPHFELLVKQPGRFAVKSFEMAGLRSQVFQELEAIWRARVPAGVRNASLLAIAKPLFQFVKQLPAYTLKTQQLSPEARAVLTTLQTAQEPDELLFTSLPQACGLAPIRHTDPTDQTAARTFRKRLVKALHELEIAYETLLSTGRQWFHAAFGVRSSPDQLRADLRVRASYLVDRCLEPLLKRFTLAATDSSLTDTEWLESLMMILADKPAHTWSDDDRAGFELRLNDVARQFQRLEALQTEMAATHQEGFEAYRLTLTEADGHELNRVVWVDQNQEEFLDRLVDEILNQPSLRNDPKLRQALLAKLAKEELQTEAQTRAQNELQAARKRKGKRQTKGAG
ncbi:MAG: hypothetical protein ACKO7W_15220 [Elainella sp.]